MRYRNQDLISDSFTKTDSHDLLFLRAHAKLTTSIFELGDALKTNENCLNNVIEVYYWLKVCDSFYYDYYVLYTVPESRIDESFETIGECDKFYRLARFILASVECCSQAELTNKVESSGNDLRYLMQYVFTLLTRKYSQTYLESELTKRGKR